MEECDDRDHPTEKLIINDVVIKEITEGLKAEEFEIHLKARPADWLDIAAALNRYRDEFLYWDEFPNLGQIDQYENIRGKSSKLLEALEQVTIDGPSLVLSDELGEHGLSVLMASLEVLAKMEFNSPKKDKDYERFRKRHFEVFRAKLQSEIDGWWRRVTGQKPAVHEEGGSSFSFFLSEIFKTLPPRVQVGLGSSRSAVKERRRAARKLFAR